NRIKKEKQPSSCLATREDCFHRKYFLMLCINITLKAFKIQAFQIPFCGAYRRYFLMDDEAKQLQIQPKEHLQEWTDLWFSKHKKAGYIAITDFEQQFFYGTNDIKKVKGITA